MSSRIDIDDQYDEVLVQKYRSSMSETHKSLENQTLAWRIQQLDTMEQMLIDHEEELVQALFEDLHKDPTESRICEICILRNEISYMKQNLRKWMKPKPKPSPMLLLPFHTEVRPMPLCEPAVLIIGPFNYPVLLGLLPAIGALVGGNPIILKPSELCPAVATLLEHLISSYFDQGVFRVINGAIQTSEGLLKQPWGLIFFTGSERVGKIVAQAAAKTLTPVVLELGGKSPVYLDQGFSDSEFKVAVDRIIGGKTMNAGQTCIAPDYLLCHDSQIERFKSECKKSIQSMFGENVEESGHARIVTVENAKRLIEGIKEVEQIDGTEIICGGSQGCNVEKKFVTPTIVLFDSADHDCSVLQNEIFGPILPVIPVKEANDAIQIINQKRGTPLALYAFTKSKICYEIFLTQCPAANYAKNEVLLSFVIDAPFGGKGSSGNGEYRGKASFRTFTKSIVSYSHPCSPHCEAGGLRYQPFTGAKKFLPSIMLKLPTYFPVINMTNWIAAILLILSLIYLPVLKMLPKPMIHSIANYLSDWSNHLKDLP